MTGQVEQGRTDDRTHTLAPSGSLGGRARVFFPGLDGLRAIAAILVVIYHVTNSVAPFFARAELDGTVTQAWVGAGVLARFGNWGVSIFFVLSGFLLYRPLVSAWLEGRSSGTLGSYLSRRIVRIVPAYWLVLTYYLFVVRDQPPAGGRGDYLLFYFFAQNYRDGYVDRGGGMAVAWTLCIEMSFYLVLPILAWLLRKLSPTGWTAVARVRSQLAMLAALSLGSVVLRYWVIAEHPLQTFWLPAHFAWFGLGMIAAVWHSAGRIGVRLPAAIGLIGRYPQLCWLFAAQIFWLTSLIPVAGWVNTRTEYMWFFIGNGASAALLMYPLVFGDQTRGWLRRALSGFPLRPLGEISYGIYLWHTIWLVVIVDRFRSDLMSSFWPRFAVVAVLTITVAWLSLTIVERPLMRWVQRLTAPRRPVAVVGRDG